MHPGINGNQTAQRYVVNQITLLCRHIRRNMIIAHLFCLHINNQRFNPFLNRTVRIIPEVGIIDIPILSIRIREGQAMLAKGWFCIGKSSPNWFIALNCLS